MQRGEGGTEAERGAEARREGAGATGVRAALATSRRRLRRRIQRDFQFAAMLLFATATVVALAPFAVWRMLGDAPWRGAMNGAVVLGMVLLCVWAWRSRDARRPALVVTCFHTAMAVATAWRFGPEVLLWMYPIAIANYVLVGRRLATAVNLFALLGLCALGPDPRVFGAGGGFFAGFFASYLLVCMLALVFATLNAQQRRQMEAQALLDPLTGAANRRALARELEVVEARRSRLREPWGAAVFDLDHFKRINDRLGHEVGDQVLVAFAELLRRRTRPTDRVFRLGGEEFLLLAPGGDAATLQALANKLCDAVRASLALPEMPVTVSIGVAMLGEGEAAKDWLGRADAATYRAKALGRDRVEVADPPA